MNKIIINNDIHAFYWDFPPSVELNSTHTTNQIRLTKKDLEILIEFLEKNE